MNFFIFSIFEDARAFQHVFYDCNRLVWITKLNDKSQDSASSPAQRSSESVSRILCSSSLSALPVLVLAEGDLLMRCHTVMFCHPDMCVVWDVAAALLLNAGQCNLSCVHKRAASLFLWFILTDFRDRRHHNN